MDDKCDSSSQYDFSFNQDSKQQKIGDSMWTRFIPSLSTFLPHVWIRFLFNSFSRLSLLTVLSVAIIWCAAFVYITFYYNFIPVMIHRRPVDLVFDTRCEAETCSQPSANLTLVDRNTPRMFARGQAYKITIDLHMPESEVNWQQGTFMIRMKLMDNQRRQVAERVRSAILKYKSPLTRIINDIICWPLLLAGLKDDSQFVQITVFDEYIDNLNGIGEATHAEIKVEARKIEIYSAEVRIDAVLSGIKYFMVYWPFTSSLFGVSVITSFLTILAVGSLHNVLFDQLLVSVQDSKRGQGDDDQRQEQYEDDDDEESNFKRDAEAEFFEGSEEVDDHIFN